MSFDIEGLSELKPDVISEIRGLVHDIFETGDQKRDQHIDRLIQEVSLQLKDGEINDEFLASAAVFFNEAFMFISAQDFSGNSDLYKFFRIINHLPILDYSRFYDQTMDVLKPYFEHDPKNVKLFDRLQLLYLYSEIGYEYAAQRLAGELLAQIDPDQLCFYVMYQLNKARIFNAHGDAKSEMKLMLDLAIRVWDEGGPEATLFVMTNWLFTLSWFKSSRYYKALLFNLYEKIRGMECLNTARVGYELFLLDDKQVAPAEKMRYFQDLVKFHETILNSSQLHSLHFFAGKIGRAHV